MNERLSATATGGLRLPERGGDPLAPQVAPARPRVKPIYSTAGARFAAEKAGVRGCLEEAVRLAILGGRKRRSLPGLPPREAGAYVVLDDHAILVAVLARIPARLQPERGAWLVVDVIRPPRPFSLRAARKGERTAAVEAGPRQRPQGATSARLGGRDDGNTCSLGSAELRAQNGSYRPGREAA
jgi:hypothetical protein